MLTKTPAIVLHALKYSDNRLIVDVFSRTSGRLSLIATLPKSGRGRLKKQYFQPATLLEIEYEKRPTVSLQQLKDARLRVAWQTIPFTPEKVALALFTAEFLCHALRSEGEDVALFDYISDSLEWLDVSPSGYANFHLTLLIRLSRFLGFYPNLDLYTDGSLFDLRAASFTTVAPLHRDFLSAADSRQIHQLMRMDYPTMHLFRLSRHDRNRILDVLITYYRLHIPQFPELRSLDVLRGLWA